MDGHPVYQYFSAAYVPDITYDPPPWLSSSPSRPNDTTVTIPSLILSVWDPIGFKNASEFIVQAFCQFRVECQPTAVTYDLTVRFDDGVRSLSYALKDDVWLLSDIYVTYALVPGYDDVYAANNWIKGQLSNYRFSNLFALTDSVAQSLIDNYPVNVFPSSNESRSLQTSLSAMEPRPRFYQTSSSRASTKPTLGALVSLLCHFSTSASHY